MHRDIRNMAAGRQLARQTAVSPSDLYIDQWPTAAAAAGVKFRQCVPKGCKGNLKSNSGDVIFY